MTLEVQDFYEILQSDPFDRTPKKPPRIYFLAGYKLALRASNRRNTR